MTNLYKNKGEKKKVANKELLISTYRSSKKKKEKKRWVGYLSEDDRWNHVNSRRTKNERKRKLENKRP